MSIQRLNSKGCWASLIGEALLPGPISRVNSAALFVASRWGCAPTNFENSCDLK